MALIAPSRTSKRSRWVHGTGRVCRPEARPWCRKPPGASAWRRQGDQWVAEAFAREAASEGSTWRFFGRNASIGRNEAATRQIRSGDQPDSSPSPWSYSRRRPIPRECPAAVPRRQTRPASCPHLLQVTYAAAILAHRDHTSRAESDAVGHSLEMRSRLEYDHGGGEELGWSPERMCRVAASFRPLECISTQKAPCRSLRSRLASERFSHPLVSSHPPS